MQGPRKVQAVTTVGWQKDGATFVVNHTLQYDRARQVIEAANQKCFWIPDFMRGIPEPEVYGGEVSATRKLFRAVQKALSMEGLMPCLFLAGKCCLCLVRIPMSDFYCSIKSFLLYPTCQRPFPYTVSSCPCKCYKM